MLEPGPLPLLAVCVWPWASPLKDRFLPYFPIWRVRRLDQILSRFCLTPLWWSSYLLKTVKNKWKMCQLEEKVGRGAGSGGRRWIKEPFTQLKTLFLLTLLLRCLWRQRKNTGIWSCHWGRQCGQEYDQEAQVTSHSKWLAKGLMKVGYLGPSQKWRVSMKYKTWGCISWDGLSDHQGYPPTSLDAICGGIGTNKWEGLEMGPRGLQFHQHLWWFLDLGFKTTDMVHPLAYKWDSTSSFFSASFWWWFNVEK